MKGWFLIWLERYDTALVKLAEACLHPLYGWVSQRTIEVLLIAVYAACCFTPPNSGPMFFVNLLSAAMVSYFMWNQIRVNFYHSPLMSRASQRKVPIFRYVRVGIQVAITLFFLSEYFASKNQLHHILDLTRDLDYILFQYAVILDDNGDPGHRRRRAVAVLKNLFHIPVYQPR